MNMTTITLAEIFSKPLPTDVPLFLDWHIYDIPETIKKAIYNAPSNVEAISFNNTAMPPRWKRMVMQWCNDNEIKARWWTNPENK